MQTERIQVAKNFTRFPAGRFVSDGRYSGERFRNEILAPTLREGKVASVELDGVMGYGSSFLEEAFGGMLRVGFTPEQLDSGIRLVSANNSLIEEIKSYMKISGRE